MFVRQVNFALLLRRHSFVKTLSVFGYVPDSHATFTFPFQGAPQLLAMKR